MALWVVRAGKHGERENFAIANNVVVVNGKRVSNLLEFQYPDRLLEFLRDKFPHRVPGTVTKWRNQLWNFAQEVQVGDIVALPLKTQSVVAFGRIIGGYRHDPDAPVGAKHQRPVQWINTDFPRNRIDSDLLPSSLDLQMAVFRVKCDEAARIKALIDASKQGRYRDPRACPP